MSASRFEHILALGEGDVVPRQAFAAAVLAVREASDKGYQGDAVSLSLLRENGPNYTIFDPEIITSPESHGPFDGLSAVSGEALHWVLDGHGDAGRMLISPKLLPQSGLARLLRRPQQVQLSILHIPAA